MSEASFSKCLMRYSYIHSVLAPLSKCCPHLEGRLLTRYSPVRHLVFTEINTPFDLHVLSTPPAFVLSQDQTLVFEKFEWLLIRLFKIFVSNLLLANWLRFLFGFLHPHTFSETLFSFQSTTFVRLNQTAFIFYQTLKLLSRTFLNLFFVAFAFAWRHLNMLPAFLSLCKYFFCFFFAWLFILLSSSLLSKRLY